MDRKLRIGQQIYTIDHARTLEDLEPKTITDLTKERVCWGEDGCVSIGIDYVYTSKKEAAKALIDELRKEIEQAKKTIERAEWNLKASSVALRDSRNQYHKEFKEDI